MSTVDEAVRSIQGAALTPWTVRGDHEIVDARGGLVATVADHNDARAIVDTVNVLENYSDELADLRDELATAEDEAVDRGADLVKVERRLDRAEERAGEAEKQVQRLKEENESLRQDIARLEESEAYELVEALDERGPIPGLPEDVVLEGSIGETLVFTADGAAAQSLHRLLPEALLPEDASTDFKHAMLLPSGTRVLKLRRAVEPKREAAE